MDLGLTSFFYDSAAVSVSVSVSPVEEELRKKTVTGKTADRSAGKEKESGKVRRAEGAEEDEDELVSSIDTAVTCDSDDMSDESLPDGSSSPSSSPSSSTATASSSSSAKNKKPIRDISAPFQPSPRPTPRFTPMTERDRPESRVDFLSTTFQALDSQENIIYDRYVGPTPESNWVIPGKLLVGAYPASQDDTETFDLLTSILKLGICKFVCLQLEYKSGVPEQQWRNGQALRPYFEDLSLLVKNKQMFKVLADDENVCDHDQLNFVHFPIKDCSVTDDSGVFNLAIELVEAIAAGEIIYLHCWGGHGRTGTLVSIMLHLMYGLSAEESMAYCQRTHDLRQCPVVVGSPQTQSQCAQVCRIVESMERQEHRYRLAKQHKNREPCYFRFDETTGEEEVEEEVSQTPNDKEEELLCKRMAGKSFDAVEQDGVYNMITSHTSTTADKSPLSPSTSPSDSHETASPSGQSSSGNKGKTSQPPLKFRLVEKDANSTRNAYTQRVLGQMPKPSPSPPKLPTRGTTTTATDSLPSVPPCGLEASKEGGKSEVKVEESVPSEKPQPPKEHPRSSSHWKGSLRGLRTHSSGDKSSEVQAVSTTAEVEVQKESGKGKRWSLSGTFIKKKTTSSSKSMEANNHNNSGTGSNTTRTVITAI